jgi:hypothetical protein
MGWSSAGEIFDVVARELIDSGAPDDVVGRVRSVLIRNLQYGDWDTEDESLGQFLDHPAIVQAFREHGVFKSCAYQGASDDEWCELETGHAGVHQDCKGRDFS